MIHDARPGIALRRLLPPGARLWLVRPVTAQCAATLGLLLLHRLPDFLVALGGEVVRRG